MLQRGPIPTYELRYWKGSNSEPVQLRYWTRAMYNKIGSKDGECCIAALTVYKCHQSPPSTKRSRIGADTTHHQMQQWQQQQHTRGGMGMGDEFSREDTCTASPSSTQSDRVCALHTMQRVNISSTKNTKTKAKSKQRGVDQTSSCLTIDHGQYSQKSSIFCFKGSSSSICRNAKKRENSLLEKR